MHLSDEYAAGAFDHRDLTGYTLDGTFTAVTFRCATLIRARLSGTFVDVDFSGAVLTFAEFSEGDFTRVTFKNAVMQPDQLEQAAGFTDVTLPDGTIVSDDL